MSTKTTALLALAVSSWVIVFLRFEVKAALSGPYTIELQKIEQCEDQGTNEVGYYNLSKLENGNHKISFFLGSPMDKDFKLCLEALETKPDGSQKLHQFNCRSCEQAWIFMADYFTNLMISAGVQPEEKCICPKGHYTANNWNVSQAFPLIPVLGYNNFTVKATYFRKGVKQGCTFFFVKMNPK